MDLIYSVKYNEYIYFFEADYFVFMLNLSSKENISDNFRQGLINIDTEEKINSYLLYLEEFKINLDDLKEDYESLSEKEKTESYFCFLPTILINFNTRFFYCSHPESYYLGFENHLPSNWQYIEQQNIMSLIPLQKIYWLTWEIKSI
ncbi:hypothetical protein BI308_15835 [Roseofilum reptotaenium AO1-A]|uniref:Uncharacterized protein n=1 Tax=Roseofilum reptotaenium AO1-A TaxID=1925591 RepID=A0A1L9QPR3_9CYAN|nr:hypothetical protein BI308_15835 [Roseofilum reptotaenium AO1-A]